MLTKEKANYQVKLILSYLSKEEYEKIPKDLIKYIENNYEYDEKIKIDPNVPLENQPIDKEACKLLEKIINAIEDSEDISKLKQESLDANFFDSGDYEVVMSNITWEKVLNDVSSEKAKNEKAKELLIKYTQLVKEKDTQIENLKKSNEELYEVIKRIPKFFRKIFIKDDIEKFLK